VVDIWTARQSQNMISGTINGAAFTPGTFNVNTATEQWNSYFPTVTQNLSPPYYTILYKDGSAPSPPSPSPSPSPAPTPSGSANFRGIPMSSTEAGANQQALEQTLGIVFDTLDKLGQIVE